MSTKELVETTRYILSSKQIISLLREDKRVECRRNSFGYWEQLLWKLKSKPKRQGNVVPGRGTEGKEAA